MMSLGYPPGWNEALGESINHEWPWPSATGDEFFQVVPAEEISQVVPADEGWRVERTYGRPGWMPVVCWLITRTRIQPVVQDMGLKIVRGDLIKRIEFAKRSLTDGIE